MGVYKGIIDGQLVVEKKDKKLSIVAISMTDEDEVFAKIFVEELSRQAIDYYTTYKSNKARQNVDILQAKTDSVRGLLYGNIAGIAEANDLNVNPLRQSLRAPAQRKSIDLQVNTALYGELIKNLELSKLSLRKETPFIEVIDTPMFPLRKKKMGRLMGAIFFAFGAGCFAVFYFTIRKLFRKNPMTKTVNKN